MKYIDNVLNSITMYILVLAGLVALAGIAIVLSLFDLFSINASSLVLSFLVLLASSAIAEWIFSRLFNRPANKESAYITGAILFFISVPGSSLSSLLMLAAVSFIAIGSKYILALRGKHIFNPAAAGVFIAGMLGLGVSGWWIGSSLFILPVIILGFLVVRKIRRFTLLISFLVTAFSILTLMGTPPINILLSWPTIFFGTIMLTEPQTTPPGRNRQIAYGVLVGILFASPLQFVGVYFTHELALLIGNIFAFLMSPQGIFRLSFVSSSKLSANIHEFVYSSKKDIPFSAGQYLEWTLPHKNSDLRGTRRFFTIASAPEDTHVRIGVRIHEQGSTFKEALLDLEPGDTIIAKNLSGDFVLPNDPTKKLTFIAGGIGITPFRSMITHLENKDEKRDITLLYTAASSSEFVYKKKFEQAAPNVGVKTVYLPTDERGFLTDEIIRQEIPDFEERVFYLSGPNAMVESYKELIRKMGVPTRIIKTDYFPGY